MAETHDAGPLYVQRVNYPATKNLPLLERGWTTEIEYPYRRGRALVVRIPFTLIGFAIGLWGEKNEEDANLLRAVSGREVEQWELDEILAQARP